MLAMQVNNSYCGRMYYLILNIFFIAPLVQVMIAIMPEEHWAQRFLLLSPVLQETLLTISTRIRKTKGKQIKSKFLFLGFMLLFCVKGMHLIFVLFQFSGHLLWNLSSVLMRDCKGVLPDLKQKVLRKPTVLCFQIIHHL